MFYRKNWILNDSIVRFIYNPFINLKIVFFNKRLIHSSIMSFVDDLNISLNDEDYMLNIDTNENKVLTSLYNNKKELIPSIDNCKTPWWFILCVFVNLLVPIFTYEVASSWILLSVTLLFQRHIVKKGDLKTKYKIIICIISSLAFALFFKGRYFILK